MCVCVIGAHYYFCTISTLDCSFSGLSDPAALRGYSSIITPKIPVFSVYSLKLIKGKLKTRWTLGFSKFRHELRENKQTYITFDVCLVHSRREKTHHPLRSCCRINVARPAGIVGHYSAI